MRRIVHWSQKQYQEFRKRELFRAELFFAALLLIFVICLVLIWINSGPVVLGTELNTNGLVEYLCLGRGCEQYPAMDW
ncbi:MAG: hypothetical protein WC807_17090 [Hyphomicrobium sp.]|jgi:hypothetical protein